MGTYLFSQVFIWPSCLLSLSNYLCWFPSTMIDLILRKYELKKKKKYQIIFKKKKKKKNLGAVSPEVTEQCGFSRPTNYQLGLSVQRTHPNGFWVHSTASWVSLSQSPSKPTYTADRVQPT